MTYGYIRVSTDKQTVENQRFEVLKFAEKNNLTVDGWIEETISGTKEYTKRQLGQLLSKVQKGDLIVCSELSRLGRSLFMVLEILNICLKKECRVWTIKDGYKLGDDIQSKVLAFAFGLVAEIERNMISQRTKVALARKKAEGVVLGRPKRGKGTGKCKLMEREKQFRQLWNETHNVSEIGRRMGVNRNTVRDYMKRIGVTHQQGEVCVSKRGRRKGRKGALDGREWEFWQLMAETHNQSEVARIMGVTPCTVHNYLTRHRHDIKRSH